MMTRGQILILMLAALAAALLLAGCREQIPATALEAFITRTESLDSDVLQDTLRAVIAEGPPHSVYAGFLLGNHFHTAAADSAQRAGWHDMGVAVLLDSATVQFEQVVAQDSTFIEGLVNLGSVWDDRSEGLTDRAQKENALAQAERYYLLALDQNEGDDKARCNLGGLYLRQRKKSDALREFTTALEHTPESPLAHYNLAIMFAESKMYREAIKEWDLAARYDGDGDVGERSRDNLRIIKEMMNAPGEIADQ